MAEKQDVVVATRADGDPARAIHTIPATEHSDRSGADYVAKVQITYRDGSLLANVGETCARVDPKALGWLEQCGAIARVAAPADALKEAIDG